MIPCSISEPSQVFFLGRPVEVVCSNMSPLKDTYDSFQASPVLHFLPAATLGAVGLGEGNTLRLYGPFRSDLCENDRCVVLGGYLDIWTLGGNFGKMII